MKRSLRDSDLQQSLFEEKALFAQSANSTSMSIVIDPYISELDGVSTTKRGANEQNGVHAWHPYYAGYAEKFVDDTLTMLVQEHDTILDPWNGSGTTTLVAQKRGYRAIGIEINPVMAIHSMAKNLKLVSCESDIIVRTNRILSEDLGGDDSGSQPSEDLDRWVPSVALRTLRKIKVALLKTPATSGNHSEQAFFLSALFQTLREIGKFGNRSNPTWIKPGELVNEMSARQVITHFRAKIHCMLADLSSGVTKSIEASPRIIVGDSRRIPLAENSVDLVITSPPYCTRIDYAYATLPELLLLGYTEKGGVDAFRRLTMGAPVIVNKRLTLQPAWGIRCARFLNSVSEHTSKASKSYYLPNYLQYFSDAELSLRELKRVLKAGGRCVIVVQSSYYKNIELPLGEIFIEMARELGFQAEIGRREVVRRHMAHINTKSNQYLTNKVYHEDAVLLRH